MIPARALWRVGCICIALAGCATPGVRPSAARAPETQVARSKLTLDTPIREICGEARGRAALDRNLPGLRTNPNYFLFQGFTLRQLASMSGGKISPADLESVRLDLSRSR